MRSSGCSATGSRSRRDAARPRPVAPALRGGGGGARRPAARHREPDQRLAPRRVRRPLALRATRLDRLRRRPARAPRSAAGGGRGLAPLPRQAAGRGPPRPGHRRSTGRRPAASAASSSPTHGGLGELDLVAMLRGGEGPGDPVGHPLLLVCAHGVRDRCCAKYGQELVPQPQRARAGRLGVADESRRRRPLRRQPRRAPRGPLLRPGRARGGAARPRQLPRRADRPRLLPRPLVRSVSRCRRPRPPCASGPA